MRIFFSKLAARPKSPLPIVAVWLFGSVARGEDHAGSDVDLALLTDKPRPATLLAQPLDLEAELTKLVGRTVQTVLARTAPTGLVHRIMRDGILLIDRDRSARIAFEVAARNRYFDMSPLWRLYRTPRKAS